MARVYLKGLPQLKAKLIKLKEQTAEQIRPAMAQAAQSVVDMMQRQVPVDSGDLRESIGWTFGDKPKYAQAVSRQSVGGLTVTIFAGNTKVRYAHLVEFGTAPHAQGGMFEGTEHPGTNAQPFFYPSWRASRKAVKAALRKAIKEAVRNAVK